MADLRQAAQQALEALEQCGLNDTHRSYQFEHAARAALRAALAQQAEPVQEPAFHGFMSDDGTQVDVCFSPSAPRKDGTYATAYYTAPPRREWKSLSDAEVQAIHQSLCNTVGSDYRTVARAVEAKLKEKNHE